jgi:hypothetical protein
MSDNRVQEIVALARECLTPNEIKALVRDLQLELEDIISAQITRLIKKDDVVWLATYRSIYKELKCHKQRSQNVSINAQDLPDTLQDT